METFYHERRCSVRSPVPSNWDLPLVYNAESFAASVLLRCRTFVLLAVAWHEGSRCCASNWPLSECVAGSIFRKHWNAKGFVEEIRFIPWNYLEQPSLFSSGDRIWNLENRSPRIVYWIARTIVQLMVERTREYYIDYSINNSASNLPFPW